MLPIPLQPVASPRMFETFYNKYCYTTPERDLDITDLYQWRERQKKQVCSAWGEIGPCQLGTPRMLSLERMNLYPEKEKWRVEMSRSDNEKIAQNKRYGCLLTNYETSLRNNTYLCSRQFFGPAGHW